MVPISGQYAHARGRVRFLRLALGLVAGTLGHAIVSADAASSRERISLPYSCNIERGRLKVEPTSDKSYPIMGQREQQVHTYCPDQTGTKCRTWTVHRFAVSCGGTRTAWSEIVAAATASDRANVALENGQLLLRVAPSATWHERLCGDLERAPWRGPATWERCQGRGGNGAKSVLRSHMVALPRGFAPLALVGARILPEPEQAPRTVAIDGTAPKPADGAPSLANERTVVSDLPPIAQHRRVPQAPMQTPFSEPAYENDEPGGSPVDTSTQISALLNEEPQQVPAQQTEPAHIVLKPGSPAVEAFAAVAMAPSAATAATLPARDEPPLIQRVKVELGKAWPVGWTTRVEATPSTASREDHSSTVPHAVVQALVAGLLGTALLVMVTVTRRRRSVRVRSSRVNPDFTSHSSYTDGDGERAVALRTKSDGHIALITNALDRLATVAPLRNALSRELQSSERRLAVVIAAIGTPKATPEDWTKARRRLERIAQDLDRLQQISDSAVHSLSGLSAVRSLPRNKDEAYATLGITSGVSEPILKKLVEALRVGWHPDLAQGEADRALRDSRIKEINVAWDLITGKRQSE